MSRLPFDPLTHQGINIHAADDKTRVIAVLRRKDATDAEWAFLLQDLANVQDPTTPDSQGVQ